MGTKRTAHFRAGDSFVMQAGLAMEGYVPVYIKKCFAISQLNPHALNAAF
ncbi:hypothetical protein [Leisingera aquimarina]|nr:hypothetical protein [Leisingera aquimarina]